ncbi:MAG: fumarylacetoacetase [Bacteroidetes bacterium]|jgi:fumarylacetoacetase|nr:fumarylacetoacetase [Bacteroidota bacterium]
MNTWIDVPTNSDFSIYNLPYGVFLRDDKLTPGVAIGDSIIDLNACAKVGLFADLGFETSVFESDVLNDFIACGKSAWSALRAYLTAQLTVVGTLYEFREKVIVNRLGAKMCMPVKVGDYTDFYSSIEHATNVGKMFRPDNPLLPNWKHIPVGYHGRASSIVVSGTPITRPSGQMMPPDATAPIFGKSKRMDLELEMAFIIGKPNALGEPVDIDNAEDHIFGKVVFNDWSARDIQKWEYVPLGPFLGKNFGSSISPWIVTMEALEPFRCESVKQDPEVLPYLQYSGNKNFDINLEVGLTPEGDEETTIAESNFKYMYWNMAQQLTHHTVNGCNLNVGDMMASGTISGKEKGSFGSMLELSWGGKETIELNNGKTRTFIDDGDTITIRAWCEKDGKRVGFGECSGKILP